MARATKKDKIIQDANAVLANYNFPITFREVYYQMVVRKMIENNRSNYKMVSEALVFGRKTGQVRYAAIVDDDRDVTNEMPNSPWDVPSRVRSAISELDARIHVSPAIYQREMDALFLEKKALVRVVANAFQGRSGFIFAACKGYNSLTHIKQIAETFGKVPETIEKVHVHYMGDHDPSGTDIERNLREQLTELGGSWASWTRVAILPEQIRAYNLPPDPVKEKDARTASWSDGGVGGTVELDALDPHLLIQIAAKAIRAHWDKSVEQPCQRLSRALTRHYQKRVVAAFKAKLAEEEA